MALSKFASKFGRSAPATPPAPLPDTPAEPVAAAPDAVVETKGEPSKPEPAAAVVADADTSEPRAARLVEGERPRSAVAGQVATARRHLARAAAGAADRVRSVPRPAAVAAGLALAVGLGYGLGTFGRGGESESIAALRWSEAADGLRQGHQEIGRLAAELKAVKASVDGLRGERERSRTDLSARHAQLVEKVEKTGQENSVKIGRVAEQLDRVEKTQRDPARLQGLTDRLERIEKTVGAAPAPAVAAAPVPPPGQVLAAAAPTPPPKPAAPATEPTQTGSIAEPKPAKAETDLRKTPLEGYVLRDVEEGYALIETRSGRFVEVATGETLPGVGRVEAIERRGRVWVVVTPKGFIGQRWN